MPSGASEGLFDRLFERYLDPLESKVLRLFYGLHGESLSLDEIGPVLGLSRDEVREIRNRAVEKLRTSADSEGLSELTRLEAENARSDTDALRNAILHHDDVLAVGGTTLDLFATVEKLIEIESPESLEITIEPGDATAEDLAAFYSALSDLYRAFGGTGLVFRSRADVGLTSGAL